MILIKYATKEDANFWFTLDAHMSEKEYYLKVNENRAYIIYDDHKPIGIMRYNLFWDNLPFLTMIHLDESYQGKGFGKEAMLFWENEMRNLGYGVVMTSTQADEEAQYFYRKLGYKDNGCLVMDLPQVKQPLEIFLIKGL